MKELSFETMDDGLGVVDPIERHRYVLSTSELVSPVPADTEAFRFPVDTAVSVRTHKISLPSIVLVNVRDETGAILVRAEHFAYEELPEGEYSIELSAPIKLYLRVESSLTVSADAERMHLDFGDCTEVVVGARSHHDRPATTVTTTTDPEDMMRAVSTFGSALKTTSPERSYPTLRGHPPTVEIGEELDLAGLEPPDTGITIEVPPEYRAIFVVSSLAYYLGATVVPGEQPLLRTDTGFEYSLERPNFERTVERTLKQVFFLDCLTRTEGLYPVDLHERRALESVLELDFTALYDDSLADQLEAYLSVPFETLEDHLPEWKLTTHVEPTPTSVEMLPFVVDDLAVVQSPRAREVSVSDVWAATLDEFLRGDTRSASAQTGGGSSFVQPATSSSLEAAWVGEGTPFGASKATLEAYKNRLDRTPTEGNIGITVVCNDAAMDEERGLVDEIYGDRAELPFDITVKHNLTTAALRAVLASRTDFLHYIGHIDNEGFECVDGTLDAAELDSVGVDAFLLNACQSYQQGMALIESGSIGGIVTLSDVLNRDAVTMGRAFAGLLNCGFPLRAALEIARGESIVGGQYIVVGDGGLAITQAESGTPNLCAVERTGETFRVEQRTYPTSESGLGSLFVPCAGDDGEYYLSSGTIRTFEMSTTEMEQFLELETIPVKIDGKLHWSDRLDVGDRYGPR